MRRKYTLDNISSKVRGIIVRKLKGTSFLPFIYRSYWHFLLFPNNKKSSAVQQFYAARPNPGAGIGHQMANWHAGLWYSNQFGLNHAHIPFSTEVWDRFLGYGEGEITLDQLRKQGYKVRRLPFFFEEMEKAVDLNRKIISSYAGKRIVFLAEQDQRYDEQFGVMKEIQHRFYNAPSRREDHIFFDNDHYNIAIHVRRGDIMVDQSDPSLAMRYLANDYYYNVLNTIINHIQSDKEVHIYFFSQGKPEDYPEFMEFKNLHWCFDMNACDSFLYMVYADLLITSKSSFSYKPALLNKGIKVCPSNFWHSYPTTSDWILFDDEGLICVPSSLQFLTNSPK